MTNTYTLHLEVKTDQRFWGFYNPAIDEARAYPRTEDGVVKAAKRLAKYAKSQDWIKEARIKIYEGRVYHYHKDKKEIGVVNV